MMIKSFVTACADVLLVIGTVGAAQKSSSGPEVIKAVAPVYPLIAIAADVSGSVTVEVQLDADGKVTSARAVEGPKLLRPAAEHSAQRWVFSRVTGKSKPRVARLIFSFKLMPKNVSSDELVPIFMPPYEVEVKSTKPEIVHRVDSDP
jgi:TonB family protein